MRLNQSADDLEGCILKVPIVGKQADPRLDVSHHGRSYNGKLFHGTSFSFLPAILSTGCLLRCSVPTRGKYAIWSGEAAFRALMYAPPVALGGKQIQCVLGVQAFRVKSSHFTSTDKQLMLRECWAQLECLMVFEYRGQQLYKKRVHPLSNFLPPFAWSPDYSNWEALPAPWVVANSTFNPVDEREGVPPMPFPM